MNTWRKSYSRTIEVGSEIIWSVLADVETWSKWNPGVIDVQMDGDFKTGNNFLMTLPGGEIIKSYLTVVIANKQFTDKTLVGFTTVIVEHSVEKITEDRTLVTYLAHVEGPDAQTVGEAVTGDFLDVLEGLETYVLSK